MVWLCPTCWEPNESHSSRCVICFDPRETPCMGFRVPSELLEECSSLQFMTPREQQQQEQQEQQPRGGKPLVSSSLSRGPKERKHSVLFAESLFTIDVPQIDESSSAKVEIPSGANVKPSISTTVTVAAAAATTTTTTTTVPDSVTAVPIPPLPTTAASSKLPKPSSSSSTSTSTSTSTSIAQAKAKAKVKAKATAKPRPSSAPTKATTTTTTTTTISKLSSAKKVAPSLTSTPAPAPAPASKPKAVVAVRGAGGKLTAPASKSKPKPKPKPRAAVIPPGGEGGRSTTATTTTTTTTTATTAKADPMVCPSCGKTTAQAFDDEVLTVGSQRYHTHCFKCTGCQKLILAQDAQSGGGVIIDQAPYHKACVPTKSCSGCGQPISATSTSQAAEPVLGLGGLLWHASCLTCELCKKPIPSVADAGILDGNKLCHKACASSSSLSSS